MLSRHSAESSIYCLCVQYDCSLDGFVISFLGPWCVFHCSSNLLGSIAIFCKNSGEENQFLGEGILVRESLGSVYKGRED